MCDQRACDQKARQETNCSERLPGRRLSYDITDVIVLDDKSSEQVIWLATLLRMSSASMLLFYAGLKDVALGGAEGSADPGKRVRNLKKKLTQIQQLREKLKSGSIKALDPDQQAKLDSESTILQEIESLQRT